MRIRSTIPLVTTLSILSAGCERDASNPGAPPPEITQSATIPACFEEITQSVGLDFTHDAALDDSFFMPQIVGSGAAMFDADGDGDLDLYLINGAPRATGTPRPSGGPVNVLLQQTPAGTFVDVTDASGLGDRGIGMGVAIGDYDNDDDLDVYVTNYGANALYRNNADGTFTDVTEVTATGVDRWSSSAAFVDYDRDGFLDLYVVNYLHYPEPTVCADDAGRPEYCGPKASPAVADTLLRNRGDGTFVDVSTATGIDDVQGKGLGVQCEDFNGDALVDIYVANDGEANQLWINDGDGTFTESAVVLGAALNMFANTEASMGVTAADIDADGDLDLFMTHLARESNTLYRNDGAGNFDDVTASVGLGAPSRRFTGFGTAFLDYDNDGAMDLAVANGRVTRAHPRRDGEHPMTPYTEPNLLFRNDGTGRFEDVSSSTGTFGTIAEVSRGLAVGDVDGDGGMDLLITNCAGPARLYRNVTENRGHWLTIRAYDPSLKRDAIGARVTVSLSGHGPGANGDGSRRLHRTINPGYSYASSCDPRAHFGLGGTDRVDSIEIRWPDGTTQSYPGVAADQAITLNRGDRN